MTTSSRASSANTSEPLTNVPTRDRARVVIVGATGMVGGYALRYALDHPGVRTVTAIGRKKVGISHAKLQEVLHGNFADCSGLAEALSDHNAAVFCLGAYTAQCRMRSCAR